MMGFMVTYPVIFAMLGRYFYLGSAVNMDLILLHLLI